MQDLTLSASPADIVRKPLFAPIAEFAAGCERPGPADWEHLNRLAATTCPQALSGGGVPIRFLAPDSVQRNYEERIYSSGEVVTRADNWHDYFNALVWLRYPRTKAALNALHVRAMRSGEPAAGRGPLRDAATQFDESGIVVVSAKPQLLELLAQRSWQELFWVHRTEVMTQMRFFVFGHGLYDALRAPFYRICGRAATLAVEREFIENGIATQCRHVDAVLAERFADARWYPRPRALLALPLLGIPGMTAANEAPEYYADAEQFRPPPAWLSV